VGRRVEKKGSAGLENTAVEGSTATRRLTSREIKTLEVGGGGEKAHRRRELKNNWETDYSKTTQEQDWTFPPNKEIRH